MTTQTDKTAKVEFYFRSHAATFERGKHDYTLSICDNCRADITVTREDGTCNLCINKIY